jgi:hypothetical protein
MLTPPLPPTDPSAAPAFKDAAGCGQWLGQLQLTNLHQAHKVLRTQLGEFNRCPADDLERLYALESLRGAVSLIQADYAKKLVAKKLPLDKDEFAIFCAINDLWQGMLTGYQRCLEACLAGNAALAPHLALICQRCMLYGGLHIIEHLYTSYEFDNRLWCQLHRLYAYCEEQGLQLEGVRDDPDGKTRTTSCVATYAKILLICHAHRADFSRRRMRRLEGWLTDWCAAITVTRPYAVNKEDTPPLAIDLNGSQGLQLPQLLLPSEHIRYLVAAPLSKLLRVKIILLQQGHSAQELELGEGLDNADCAALLTHLYQCWCEGRGGRTDERKIGAGQLAHVCYGMDRCYAHIAKKPFKQPPQYGPMDTLSRKQLAVFGRVLDEEKQHDLAAMGFTLETWQIEDESLRGSRLLLLREGGNGARLGQNQLVAARAANACAFMAGSVIWLKVTQSGQLHAGVRYMPGLPEAVALKATGINLTVSDKYVAALLLPAEPALKAPPSLVTPRDWYKPGRTVEIVRNDKVKTAVKMEQLLERGADFERVSLFAMPV